MKDYKYEEYYVLGRFREDIERNTTKFYIKVNNGDPFDNYVHLIAKENLDYMWYLWASNNEIFNINDDDILYLYIINLINKNKKNANN